MVGSKKTLQKNKAVFWLALVATVFFLALLVFNAYGYFRYWQDGRQSQRNSEIIQEIFEPYIYGGADIDGDRLMRQARELTGSGDIVAYIAIGGTNIGNLVVQGYDNEHYLYHDVFGNENVNGALFMDFRNSPDFTDPNTIIYGHNMRNGTMFHNLRYFVNQDDFVQNHRNIYVITPEITLIYEIFAAFSTNIDFYYIQVHFNSDGEFAALLNEIAHRNVINTNARPATPSDNILVLSTCTNTHQDTRFVVVGRLLTAR